MVSEIRKSASFDANSSVDGNVIMSMSAGYSNNNVTFHENCIDFAAYIAHKAEVDADVAAFKNRVYEIIINMQQTVAETETQEEPVEE